MNGGGRRDEMFRGDEDRQGFLTTLGEACAKKGKVEFNCPCGGTVSLKPLPRQLLHRRRYATIQTVQATRGCPNGCDFCSVAVFSRRTQRRRPVAEVVEEIARLPGRFFVFVDDNLMADREYARALLQALRPLRKRWITQATLSLADDPDLLKQAAEAGCLGVFVGLETFSAANLDTVGKACNQVEKYREWIQRFHRHGIGIEAGIVFGFPADRPPVFERTLRLFDDLEVDVILVSIFTPLPGTIGSPGNSIGPGASRAASGVTSGGPGPGSARSEILAGRCMARQCAPA